MHPRNLHILFIITLLALGMATSICQAEIEISPVFLDLQIPMGSTETNFITVRNTGTADANVNVSYTDWLREPAGTYDFLEGGSIERSIYNWITISPSQFRIGPGESMNVSVTLSIPTSIKNETKQEPLNGSYCGMLFIQEEARPSSPKDAGMSINVITRYGIKIYETIPNTGSLSGAVTAIRAENSSAPGGFDVIVEFHNTGTLKSAASGYVRIQDSRGQLVVEEPLTPESLVVLPNEKLWFKYAYNGEPLKPGRYQILGVIEYGAKNPVGGQMILTIRDTEQ